MVRRQDRVKKKSFRRTPGGRVVVHRFKRKKDKARCAVCGMELRATSSSRKKTPSERRPERMFGGHLCHVCAERVILYRTRIKNKDMKASEVPLIFQRYL